MRLWRPAHDREKAQFNGQSLNICPAIPCWSNITLSSDSSSVQHVGTEERVGAQDSKNNYGETACPLLCVHAHADSLATLSIALTLSLLNSPGQFKK